MQSIKKTSRGFQIIEFEDLNGSLCSLQQSSAIVSSGGLPGQSAIWLGRDRDVNDPVPTRIGPRMHLGRDEVKWLIAHLQAWIDTGEFSGHFSPVTYSKDAETDNNTFRKNWMREVNSLYLNAKTTAEACEKCGHTMEAKRYWVRAAHYSQKLLELVEEEYPEHVPEIENLKKEGLLVEQQEPKDES